jgi:hypothetical protein
MVETIAPAVCGTRRRTALALILFAAGAIGAAAAVGLALGSLGSVALVPVATALAVLGMLREAGVLRLPLPQWRRQVPERWHHDLPLPLWSLGYGAGLGVGVLTFQPVATFLVVAVAAAASGTTAAVLALSAFGAGRALGAALPPAFVDRMATLYRPMRRVNAVALALLALALVAAPAGATTLALGPGSQLDPSVSDDGTLAYTQRADSGATAVVVRPAGGGAALTIPGASEPSIRGDYLAYHDAGGIAVEKWRTRQPVLRLDGAWSKPAIAYPFLVAVVVQTTRTRMMSIDLRNGRRRFLDVLKSGDDLGRPSVDRSLAVWHKTTRSSSRILIADVRTGHVAIFRLSRMLLVSNPSLRGGVIVWVEQSLGVSRVKQRRLMTHRKARTRAKTGSPRLYWTTAVGAGGVYVTRWNTTTGHAFIDRLPR